tara:strand:+ start:195 stop:386 length:192 start_codon:yes stop_codon:yes gene_type:complete
MSNQVEKIMENQTNNDAQALQNTQQPEAASAEKSEKKKSVEATQFDPKEAKHGVDFCCGSCGG